MRLYIAEKPSLGRAIADVLPKPLKKSEGYITAANGDIVSWCIGHLLEQVEPEIYNPAYKKWSHEHLPIVPDKWQLTRKKQTSKQLTVLSKLVKQADELVHAGDPDREGQLLVDEVINFLKVSKTKRDTTKRCLISDLNPKAVAQAISPSKLRSNREFIPLSTSALARSRADWLYGINLTRAYTLQGKKAGYTGVLSVGRVQTPILGLVVRRENDIAAFQSKPFYEVWANLETKQQERFKAKWQPSEQCSAYLDEQGRNLSRPLAENVARRISHQPAEVVEVKQEKKKVPPPLPYNLSALQIDCNKAFGLNAQAVLDTCQALYEKHKLITYPRSDCRYLPKAHFTEANDVVSAVIANTTDIKNTRSQPSPYSIEQFDLTRKSKTWNDSKVGAHHAIIPTQRKTSQLNDIEAKIYGLVCRNYLAQFLPYYEFAKTIVTIKIGTGLFIAKAKKKLELGWKSIFPKKKTPQDNQHTDKNSTDKNNSNNTDDNEDPDQQLPKLTKGQQLTSLQADILEKFTSPPKPFNDATLLAAMTGIAHHVTNPELKKILRETDGLGTEATRAGIIELLFKRGFLSRKGKTIVATVTGRALIEALPEVATYPDMTALWESQLSAISEGRGTYDQLMQPLIEQLQQQVTQSRNIVPTELNGLGKPPTKKRTGSSKSRKKLSQTDAKNAVKKQIQKPRKKTQRKTAASI